MININIGQCGNQIGISYIKNILTLNGTDINIPSSNKLTLNNNISSNISPYFDTSNKLTTLIIDSEPKVIESVITSTKPKTSDVSIDKYSVFHKSNIIKDSAGRGNNWALGYIDPLTVDDEKSLYFLSSKAYRSQIERMDHYMGSIISHSTAGGTGSGVYIIQFL